MQPFPDTDFILEQARCLDRVPHDQRGPLHGVAVGVKDVMNTMGMQLSSTVSSSSLRRCLRIQDMPTQFGSPLYEGHQSRFDSSAVGILRAAGALIFGL